MADIIYLTLNGNKQGLISAGCSSYDSIGNRYQNNHSDEILVYSTDYDVCVRFLFDYSIDIYTGFINN